jgi:hypothetical protein
MVGKVFISCGQRPPERNTADKIAKLLEEKFGLNYYLAFRVQGLNDIMKITEELKASDYYLFVDFLRRDGNGLPCSLFTHQELALAHHVGFKDIIALQEEGLKPEGFLKYVQANPVYFKNEHELFGKIEELVRERRWSKDFSRNLVLESVRLFDVPITYADQTGQHVELVWHASIENRRPDVAAVNSLCILDSIRFQNGQENPSGDRNCLKWAGGLEAYQKTILPLDHGIIDVFSLHADEQGLFLHSQSDQRPRAPVAVQEGEYILKYKVYSEGFPLLPFSITVDYHRTAPGVTQWENRTAVQVMA